MNGNLLILCFIIYCAAVSVQLFYYFWFFLAPVLYRHPEPSEKLPPVSVIICARNEAENLRNFLPSVLEQDYPDFEVIVVNDCSEDETYQVLGEMLLKYPVLKVSTIGKDPRFSHSKKFAQFIGIKAASHEILLFTDADCFPVSRNWIKLMVSGFTPDTEFVLGYGGYLRKKGILNLYQRCETLFIAMQYTGMAIRGIPYMGVGRNLAYRKEVFFRNKGFGNHSHIHSGDDDLFVNSYARASSTKVEFRKDAHTRSLPDYSFSSYVKRKLRHLSTARYYKPLHKLILVCEPLSRMVFYASFAILISTMFLWQYITALILIRTGTVLTLFYLNGKKFEEKGILPFVLIFDIFSPFVNLILYSGTLRSKTVQPLWK